MKFDMEINEAGIRRFWSIHCEQNEVTICHGRVGGKGAVFLKKFYSNQEAIEYVQQAAENKRSNGYKFLKNLKRKRIDQQHQKNSGDEVVSTQRRRSPRLTKKSTKKPRKQLRRKNEAAKTYRIAKEPEIQEEVREQHREATQTKQKKQCVAPNLNSPQDEVDPRIRISYRYNILNKDGFEYNLLTKTNTSYYIIQILVDQNNTNNIKIYTRWGLYGSIGRFQLTKCRDVQHALDLFALKFADKTGRSWYERSCYRPKRGKYVWINPTLNFNNDCTHVESNNSNSNISNPNQYQIENFSCQNQQSSLQGKNFSNDQQQNQLNKIISNKNNNYYHNLSNITDSSQQLVQQNDNSDTINDTIQTNSEEINNDGTCQMDVDVQEGNILLNNLVQKILSPTLSDFENEEFFQPISCQ